MPANQILAQMAVQISANTAQFNAALKETNARLGAFQTAVQSAGKYLAGYFGISTIFRGVEEGISIMASFEKQMSTLKAISGATGDEMKVLSQTALDLGKSTQFTATQVGALQVEYSRLGFTVPEIEAATKATIDLATATGEDLTKATFLLGSSIRQFNLPASEAAHFADVMTSAFNQTALQLEDFGEAMKYVGPVAAQANISFEETSAILGILADNGIRGSTAGTSLRRIIVDLAKDGRPLVERLGELAAKGISVQNSFDDVGRIAQTSLLVLEKGRDRIVPLTQELKNSHDEAQRVSDIMRDNLTGDFDRFTGKIKSAVAEGSALNGVLRALLATMSDLFLGEDLKPKTNEADKTARKIVDDYVKGFGDAEAAAKRFRDEQYKLILAAQMELGGLEKLNKANEVFLPERQAELKAEIAGRQRLLDISLEYIRAQAAAPEAQPAKLPIMGIKEMEEEIKRLTDLMEGRLGGTFEQQAAKTADYRYQIDQLRANIAALRGEIKVLDDVVPEIAPPSEIKKIDDLANAFEGTKVEVEDGTKSLYAHEIALKKVSSQMRVNNLVMIEYDKNTQEMIGITINWARAVADVASKALSSFAYALGEAAGGQKDFGKTILDSISGFLKQFGELLIAAGVAFLAYDALKQSDSPATAVAAIAAGVALVAIAGFLHAQSNTSSGASTTTGASARATSYSGNPNGNQVYGEIVIRGQDLYVVLTNYNRNRNG